MERVVDCGDPSADAAAAPGEQQLHLGVLEERVLLRREPLVLADPKGRYPMRIAGVSAVGVVDETSKVAAAADAADRNQCSGRTTRLNSVTWRSRRNAMSRAVHE